MGGMPEICGQTGCLNSTILVCVCIVHRFDVKIYNTSPLSFFQLCNMYIPSTQSLDGITGYSVSLWPGPQQSGTREGPC